MPTAPYRQRTLVAQERLYGRVGTTLVETARLGLSGGAVLVLSDGSYLRLLGAAASVAAPYAAAPTRRYILTAQERTDG